MKKLIFPSVCIIIAFLCFGLVAQSVYAQKIDPRGLSFKQFDRRVQIADAIPTTAQESDLVNTYLCKSGLTPDAQGFVTISTLDRLLISNGKYYACTLEQYNNIIAKNLVAPDSELTGFEYLINWSALCMLS